MNRIGKIFLGACVFGLFILTLSFSESDDGPIAQRTIKSDGDKMIPFAIAVGSEVATSPFDRLGLSTFTGTSLREHRTTLIINPSADFHLMVGTFSNFRSTDTWFPIFPDSGTYTTSNHFKPFIRYAPGMAGSETVRGSIEYE